MMEVLFAVIWEDRHSNTSVHLFSDLEAAIKWAKGKAYDTARDKEDVEIQELNADMVKSNWKFYVTYSCEGDCLRIIETVVNEEVK